MKTSTSLVQSDHACGDPWRATATPIYQTATFDQDSAEEFGRYDYSRSGNPTRDALERQVAMLEGAPRAFAFASGLAAINAVAGLLSPGDEVLACDDLYGGTYRLFSGLLSRRGISVRYADLTDEKSASAAISPRTRLIYAESVSNPLMRICDIRFLASLARSRSARLCIDNTFLSPILMRPLHLGADIVIHSATKYLCGHSDVTAGTVATCDDTIAHNLAFIQNAEGAGLGPQDSYLLLRGMKTLDLRIERQQRTAERIARSLHARDDLDGVLYPGLPSSPHAARHASQASGNGAVICVRTGDAGRSRRVVESLSLFPIRVSFGGVQSSASLPCCMSHASIPPEVRASRHFPEDLIRLSIGIEDPGDLLKDLTAALDAHPRGEGHASTAESSLHAQPAITSASPCS